jgi:penicillin-binding protein 1B
MSGLFKFIAVGVLILCLLTVGWAYKLDQDIQERLKAGWFPEPVSLFSEPETMETGLLLAPEGLLTQLRSWGYQTADTGTALLEKQYQILDESQCAEQVDSPFLQDTTSCVFVRTEKDPDVSREREDTAVIGFSGSAGGPGKISVVYGGYHRDGRLQERTQFQFPPRLFAQFSVEEPILRKLLDLGEVPLQCLQAVTSAEDSEFLQHGGVSLTGLVRATLRNLMSGRYAQGGSTITQQLVKNYFLTPEKTLKRKITELLMAGLLESRVAKDEILKNYLNVVYMGQSGSFQVIGFSSAADHYINKEITRLNLPECALLAAIINSPGRFNPETHPEAARERRDWVLKKMLELGHIDTPDYERATTTPLPTRPKRQLSEPAPYFAQAVFQELSELQVEIIPGALIFTTLNEAQQELAQSKTAQHVAGLEQKNQKIAKLKAEGKNLEASLISVHVPTGRIQALVGGRRFVRSQFNRVLSGNRQVGSIMKPFVVLAALLNPPVENLNPLTVLSDQSFKHRYEGQVWAPTNYDRKFRGDVPLYVALKDSLNVPIAKLGIDTGLENIIEVATDAGVQSEMKPFPALTLGAFEIRPIEVAQSFSTIASLGIYRRIHTVQKVLVPDSAGSRSYSVENEHVNDPDVRWPATTTSVLVGMMKETLVSGTAASAVKWGYTQPAAGKTGTTSDTRDAWFVGFTPDQLVVTWAGYDDNTSSGLTGASGALPLWLEFMLKNPTHRPPRDFDWPEGTVKKAVPAETAGAVGAELIFVGD